jgi:hypothetical protein
MSKIRIIGTIFLLFCGLKGVSQNNVPLLDRKVSLNLINVTLPEALFIISETADFNLSYNSNILSTKNTVSFKCQEKKLAQIFPEILPVEIEYKTSGNNVILLKKSEKDLKKKNLVIEGKVIDTGSRKPIEYATVLDIYGSQSAITDSAGRFTLQLTHKQPELVLSISKTGYMDSSLFLVPESQEVLFNLKNIKLSKIVSYPFKKVESFSLSKFAIPQSLITNSENINGFTKRIFQLSITPGLSTNLKIAGTVKNTTSINLIGGYNYGVRALELGGVFNINRADVNGLQVAGVTNLVGGKLSGLQIAGLINRTKGKLYGVQVAGLGNNNSDDFSGWQLSGAYNFTKNFKGFQLTGAVNVADSLSGMQLSAVYNQCKQLDGLQFNSGLNVSDTMQGTQIGIINRAKKQNGFQIGIVNINDSSEGISIGIINIVKDKKLPRFGIAVGTSQNNLQEG